MTMTNHPKLDRFFRSLCIVIAAVILSVPATALTEAQLDMFAENNILFYDPAGDNCTPRYIGDIEIVGDTVEEKIWSGLISAGFTPHQAAGAMGNMRHEGNHFNPVQHEVGRYTPELRSNGVWGGSRVAFWEAQNPTKTTQRTAAGKFDLGANADVSYGIGLAQWSFGRRTRLMQYIADNDPGLNLYDYFVQPETYSTANGNMYGVNGNKFKDLAGEEIINVLYALQLQYLWDEMQTVSSYNKFFDQTDTIDDYTWYFLRHIEIPCTGECNTVELAKASRSIRFSSAHEYFDQFKDWTIPFSGGAGGPIQSTIFLSPGHGDQATPATIGSSGLVYSAGQGDSNETSNMLIVAQRLQARLESDGYKVVLARESNDANPLPVDRVQMARDAGAVLGVSVHSDVSANGIWFQEMGRWHENNPSSTNSQPSGADLSLRITFGAEQLGIAPDTAQRTASLSKQYATTISKERTTIEGRSVSTTGDASSSFSQDRGLHTYGNIPIESLLAEDIPWVYSEFATGNDGNSHLRLYRYGGNH